MGELFSRMASLVMSQSEKIANIEDDIESGLDNTMEAQRHIETTYELTKGNRGIILKIFGLLVLFILLFLYWT